MKKLRIIIPVLIVFLVMFSLFKCKKNPRAAQNLSGQDEKQTVMVEELQPRDLNDYITVSGKLEGSTDVMMVSETSGRILELYKKLGDRISKGEKLGRVDNEIYRIQVDQAEAARLSAQTGFDTASLNLSASEKLYQKGSISEVEYNSARSAFKSARAGLDGATAGLEAARRNYNNSFLAAPESGVISKLIATAGQYVSYGTQIAYITDSKSLVIKTGVGESQISKLKQGQSAEITVPGSDKTVKGVISGLGNRPLPGAANYSLELKLLSNSGLQPGMVVSAKILSGVFRNQLYTSINNIVKEYDRYYIYTIDQNDKVVRKEIQTGKVIGENVLILSGAEAGDRIVTTGIENLEDGAAVQVRS
jgi:membrane fusion protein, multidrug efflux system